MLSINVLGDAQEPRPDTEPHATPNVLGGTRFAHCDRVLARVENDRDQRELYMNAFLKHTVARGLCSTNCYHRRTKPDASGSMGCTDRVGE